MAAHRELDGIGDHLARHQRRLHTLVAHRDAVGHRDGNELARGSVGGRNPALHRLRLAHQCDVAGRSLVPAGCDADEGLMNLLRRQTHRVIIGAMRRALGTLRHMPAGQLPLVDDARFHRFPSTRRLLEQGDKTTPSRERSGHCLIPHFRCFAPQLAGDLMTGRLHATLWLNVGESVDAAGRPVTSRCGVAAAQQAWRVRAPRSPNGSETPPLLRVFPLHRAAD